MMRSLLFAASMLLASSVQVLAQEFETATSAVKNMRVGWNLGNTLDANSGSTTNMWIEKYTQRKTSDYEKAWEQPVTTEALIKMFKDAGFNAIRVPVTWYPHMGVKVNGLNWDLSAWSPTKVDAAWMARVKEIVDYVVKNGMYCIINVHHDTGDATTAWLRASTDNYNKYKDTFEDLWKQIATEFKDYDEHLLFEGYNEILDDYGSWCFASFAAPGQYNANSAADSYKAVNQYAQSFVNAVRATGGNNSYRNLIINSYCASNGSGNWNTHLLEPLKNLAALAVDERIVEVHHMAAGHPHLAVHEDGGVQPHVVGILLHKLLPPGLFHIVLQLGAQRAEVPAVGKAAVDLAGGIDIAASLAEIHDLVHGLFACVHILFPFFRGWLPWNGDLPCQYTHVRLFLQVWNVTNYPPRRPGFLPIP